MEIHFSIHTKTKHLKFHLYISFKTFLINIFLQFTLLLVFEIFLNHEVKIFYLYILTLPNFDEHGYTRASVECHDRLRNKNKNEENIFILNSDLHPLWLRGMN